MVPGGFGAAPAREWRGACRAAITWPHLEPLPDLEPLRASPPCEQARRWPSMPHTLEPLDVLSAVDVQFCTVHVARLVRTQEIDGLGHFLGLTQAPQRDLLVHQPFRAR